MLQADTLAQIALQLEAVNGAAVINSMAASAQPIWQAAVGTVLKSIQLSRHENGLYRNDALLLEFETTRVVVALSEQEGLDLFRG